MLSIIPKIKRTWKILNDEVLGDIYSMRNINFDKRGYATLSRKAVSLGTNADSGLSSMAHIQNILYFNSNYIIVTSGGVYTLDPSGPTITAVSGSPTPGFPEGDAVVFFDLLWVTLGTSVQYWSGSAWTSNAITGLTDDIPHPLCVFENLNQLAVGDGNLVKTYDADATPSLQNTLTIPAEFQVTTIRYRQSNLFIGTKHKYGGEAKVFIWNGSGTAAQQAFGVKSNWIFSLCDYASSICAVTNAGQILRYNGGGFSVLGEENGLPANFPIYYTQNPWQGSTGNLSGRVYNRGTIADGSVLYINIDGGVHTESATMGTTGYLPNQPSGLWCYDPDNGLYCKATTTAKKYVSASVSSLSSNIIAINQSANPQTGDPVFISAVGSITGISVNNTYYIIRETSLSFKLALTPYDAYSGNAITLGGSAGAATVIIADTSDAGCVGFITSPGAVGLITSEEPSESFFESNVLWGARVPSPTAITTARYTINTLSIARNIGALVTSRIYSSNLLETFQKFVLRYTPLRFNTEKITVKARTRERFGLPEGVQETATWSTSNTFTVGSTSKSLQAAQVGDEIEIIAGSKSGRTSHITSISNNAGTWTVSLEDEIGTPTETFYFQTNNWKKLGEITNTTTTNEYGYAEISTTSLPNSSWIQFKLEIEGFEVGIEESFLVSTTHRDAQK